MAESNGNAVRNRFHKNNRNVEQSSSIESLDDTSTKEANVVMPSSQWSRMACHLMKHINCFNLAVFRIIFGLIMAYHMYRATFWHRTIEANFGFPELNFHFWFARWIYKPRLQHIYWLFYTNIVSATCMGLGLCYRLSCLVFTVGYAYSNLLEKSRYNNHFYLYTLVGFLFFITDTHRRLSLDSLLARLFKSIVLKEEETPDKTAPFWKIYTFRIRSFLARVFKFFAQREEKTKVKTVPLWQLYIFRFQLSVVYFYSGLAKINYDWLIIGEPMRTWGYWNDFSLFKQLSHVLLPKAWAQDFVGYFFSITGMLFDLFISLFLLVPRLRPLGFTLSFTFHLLNHFLFKIGTFPWVMMTTHILFLEPETAESFLYHLKKKLKFIKRGTSNEKAPSPATNENQTRMRWPMKVLLWVYVITQLMVPFRHWMYSRDVNWTMEGHQFSWRMMLNEEDVLVRFNVRMKTGQKVTYNPNPLKMTLRQVKRLVTDSECILQLVQHLKATHRVWRDPGSRVFVDMWRSLNNRPYQRYANSTIDMSTTNYYAFHYDWIVPRLPDDVIDRPHIASVQNYWSKKNFSTSFFMDSPGQSFTTGLFQGNCENVTLHTAAGTVEVKIGKKRESLSKGESIVIPTQGFHKVTTQGDSNSVWYYVHDCSPGEFHSAQGFLSVPAWKEF